MLRVYLNDGTYHEIQEFEKVTFGSGNDLRTITKENIDTFFFTTQFSYRFYGSSIVLVSGDKIRSIELS